MRPTSYHCSTPLSFQTLCISLPTGDQSALGYHCRPLRITPSGWGTCEFETGHLRLRSWGTVFQPFQNTEPFLSRRTDSNRQPPDYKSGALPLKLLRHKKTGVTCVSAVIKKNRRLLLEHNQKFFSMICCTSPIRFFPEGKTEVSNLSFFITL